MTMYQARGYLARLRKSVAMSDKELEAIRLAEDLVFICELFQVFTKEELERIIKEVKKIE